jgi:acetyl esterase/lipase
VDFTFSFFVEVVYAMRIKVGSTLTRIVNNFGASRIAMLRDRFLVDTVINNLMPLPEEVRACSRKIKLSFGHAWVIDKPGKSSRRSILFAHGGAFCFSMNRLYLPFAYDIATKTDAQVIMPDYRLTPENPYPAALEDCLETLDWIKSSGGPATPIAVLGDSAGGNLALSVAQNAETINGLCLLSPWVDLSLSSPSWHAESPDIFVNPDAAKRAAWFYVIGNGDWSFGEASSHFDSEFAQKVREPSISPVFGDFSFSEETPVLIQASSSERLLGDSLMLWERLGGSPLSSESDVSSTKRASLGHHNISVWIDQPHVWQVVRKHHPQARVAIAEIVSFLNRVL